MLLSLSLKHMQIQSLSINSTNCVTTPFHDLLTATRNDKTHGYRRLVMILYIETTFKADEIFNAAVSLQIIVDQNEQ